MNKRGSIRYYTIRLTVVDVSLNSITCSRFIGYHLSLLKHPFISAAKVQKLCAIPSLILVCSHRLLYLVCFITCIDIIIIFSVFGYFKHSSQFPAEISFNIGVFKRNDNLVIHINHSKFIIVGSYNHRV